jgi:hypothetical protein
MRRGVAAGDPPLTESFDAIRNNDRTLPSLFSGEAGSVERAGDGTVATAGNTGAGGETATVGEKFNMEALEMSVVLSERGPSCRRKPTFES